MSTPLPPNRARFEPGALLEVTGGVPVAGVPAVATTSVSTDTRALGPGALFVALRGERFDAHEHLAQARAAGAAVAVVERDVTAPAGLALVRVERTQLALEALAKRHVAHWRAEGVDAGERARRLVAITGSAGKTTTRIVVAALARAASREPGSVHASTGNLNNRVGLPMVAFGLEPAHQVAVFELGTNQPGEIAALADIVAPDAAIVTSIGVAHAEGLGGLEGIVREKSALPAALAPSGVLLAPVGDAAGAPSAAAALERCIAPSRAETRVRYGLEDASADEAGYRVTRREVLASGATALEIACPGSRALRATSRLVGKAGAIAAVAAVAAVERGLGLGPVDDAMLARALDEAARELEGRLVFRELAGGRALLDDSYNANVASMRSSIDAAAELAASSGKSLVLVLGEMREMGASSEAAHAEVGAFAVDVGEEPGRARPELVVVIGSGATPLAVAARNGGLKVAFFADSARAAEAAPGLVGANALVLVKGSRGVRTELVVEALAGAHASRGVG